MQAMCDSSSPAEGPPLDRRARRGQADGRVTEKRGGGGGERGGRTGRVEGGEGGEGGEVTTVVCSQSIL